MAGPPPTAYLEGGPCDGTSRKMTAEELRTGVITCKGATYKLSNATHGTDDVFKYKAPTPSGPPPSTTLSSAAMHKGWADLQHSVNKKLPAALSESKRLRADALRSLHRARKVHL